jgi:phosphatidylserine decarboxylase
MQGKKFDKPKSKSAIEPFIKFHNLNVDEIKDPLDSFQTFNEFFYRKLKPNARPIASPDNPVSVL